MFKLTSLLLVLNTCLAHNWLPYTCTMCNKSSIHYKVGEHQCDISLPKMKLFTNEHLKSLISTTRKLYSYGIFIGNGYISPNM